ncbi:virion structural protein [Vibrio phage Vp_R1]|uniref:Tail fiber protein n=1 Tax=Vibrio phage Vp_R1 TaxID=2059867 RepID=A0A2H5BQ69_9CAUD|nr:virion structural protein [Vibrio phage Vp_R1]AUG88481.1 hypothetical protein VPR_117 [Vibrio phage Vp_R1]
MKVHNTVAKSLLQGGSVGSDTNVGQYGATEQNLKPVGSGGGGCDCEEELELLAENLNQKIESEMREFKEEVDQELDSITASATGIPHGNAPRVEYSPTQTEFLFVIPDGADGYTPVKGVDYFDGQDGAKGDKGDDGYTPVKGVDYFDGETGPIGPEGKSDNGLVNYNTLPGIPVIIDIEDGFIYNFDLVDPNTNIVINNPPPLNDRGIQITLMMTQTTGSNLITITTQGGGTVKWPNGLVPRLSYEPGSTDVITLLSIDGGVNYFGFLSGSDFK